MFKRLFGRSNAGAASVRMPDVDEPADIDAVFARARLAASGEGERPPGPPGRHVIIVTPGRMLMFKACPPPDSMAADKVASVEQMMASKVKRNVAAIAFTESGALMHDAAQAIPLSRIPARLRLYRPRRVGLRRAPVGAGIRLPERRRACSSTARWSRTCSRTGWPSPRERCGGRKSSSTIARRTRCARSRPRKTTRTRSRRGHRASHQQRNAGRSESHGYGHPFARLRHARPDRDRRGLGRAGRGAEINVPGCAESVGRKDSP